MATLVTVIVLITKLVLLATAIVELIDVIKKPKKQANKNPLTFGQVQGFEFVFNLINTTNAQRACDLKAHVSSMGLF